MGCCYSGLDECPDNCQCNNWRYATPKPRRGFEASARGGAFALGMIGTAVAGGEMVMGAAKARDLQAFAFKAFDESRLDIHEDDDCPQDDTCDCPESVEFSRLLKGWKP